MRQEAIRRARSSARSYPLVPDVDQCSAAWLRPELDDTDSGDAAITSYGVVTSRYTGLSDAPPSGEVSRTTIGYRPGATSGTVTSIEYRHSPETSCSPRYSTGESDPGDG